ncbi:MAG: HYR domain-containing protein, partial [Holophagales bacterium]|nr:HYR domain-containing protein [Holophagales bacterium]
MRSRSDRPLLASLLVLLPSVLFGQTPTLAPVARIAPPGAVADFAFRFDAEGGILVVGTPSTRETHIFVRGAGYTWDLAAVVPPGPNPPSSAGRSVVVSQGRVGAASSRGVDLYLPDGSRDSWIISGNTEVALEGDDFVGWESGSNVRNVRPMYQVSRDVWEYGAPLDYGTWFVLGLDIDADRLALLSAPLHSYDHDAYLAERDPATGEFAPSAQLVPSPADAPLRSIAISGDTAVLGAPFLTVAAEAGRGAIFVFDYDAAAGQWSQVQVLTEPDGGKNHFFGYSVALRGGLLLTSAPNVLSGGRGYLLERDSATGLFVEKAVLLDPLANGNRGFGNQLALGDDVAFLNASADDSVLAFALDPAPATSLELDPWPTCVSTPSLTVTGRASGGSSVARLYRDRPGTPAEILCQDCGVDPTFSWTATDLANCDNRFTLGLLDEHDRQTSFSSKVRFDSTPPELSLYNCRDRSFLVPAGGSVEITAPGFSDNCDRPPSGIATCDNPGPFTAGVTTVTCSETDSCGNTASCTFTVTVVEETASPVPEVRLTAPVCSAEPLVTVNGDVLADEEVTRIAASVDGGPETEICLPCGVDPSFSFDASLAACDNSVRVTARDAGGEVGEAMATVRFDGVGPILTCPDDIYANVPHAFATKAEVHFAAPTASDSCDGSLPP